MVLLFTWLIIFQTTYPPFKPMEEFEVKIDLQIKSKVVSGGDGGVKFDEQGGVEKKKNEDLPYLSLNVNFLKLHQGEVKTRISNNAGATTSKKIKEGSAIHLDLGFMKDIKDGSAVSEYNLILYNAEKKPVSRIHIIIGADGTYLVNNVLMGKF